MKEMNINKENEKKNMDEGDEKKNQRHKQFRDNSDF